MAYFKNIHSLAELKKEYRRLALENHPDKGGSTEVMQQINVEFERLHEIWKNDTTISANASGYENDYAGASAKEYLNDEIRHLRELQEVNDLQESDIELSCSGLGIESECMEYFTMVLTY